MNFVRDPGQSESKVDELRLRREFADTTVSFIHEYYGELAEAGIAPAWKSVSAGRWMRVAPWISLIDAEPGDADDTYRFRYRVIGQVVEEMLNEPVKDRTIDEVFPDRFMQQRAKLLSNVIKSQTPAFGMRDIPQQMAPTVRTLFGFFPFKGEETNHFRLLMAIQPLEEVSAPSDIAAFR